ncbi:MAG: collagen-binding domain-containing protein [Stellaceae bacterium]
MLALIATLGGSAATAQAAAITDPNILPILLADYNVIVDGQFNSTSDTEGPVLIGGDLGPGTVSLNSKDVVLGSTAGTTAITGYGEVNVFANHTAPSNNANGNVFVGGPVAGTFGSATSVTFNYAFPPGATTGDNAATFQNNIWSKITGFSTGLAGLTANSTFSAAGEFTPGASVGPGTPAIFDVTLAQLNAFAGTLSFEGCLAGAAAATPTPCDAVINVIGSGPFAQNFTFPTPLQNTGLPNVIFNFENASSVKWGLHYFDASILAPFAVAGTNGSGPLIGNLVASSVSASAPIGGELHRPTFDCSDNLCTTTSVPEPGSLPLLGGALASFAVLASFAAIRRRG